MKKVKYPTLKPGTAEYAKYMALLRVTVSGLAKKDQVLEKDDLHIYFAEIRLRLPHLIEPLNLDEDGVNRLLDEVQQELQYYYANH